MNEMKNQKDKWYEIVIDDPDFLIAKTIDNVIRTIQMCEHFQYVIINDIECSGQNWVSPILRNQMNKQLEIGELLALIEKVQQFDWGDFFLFKKFPYLWDNPQNGYYPFLIAQSDTTVRAVDNQYVYVYTRLEGLIKPLTDNYVVESVSMDFLENYVHPY